jgi:hypothetical protein
MTVIHEEEKITKDVAEQALEAFGQPGKAAVLSHMKRHGIILQDDYCSPMKDIEAALEKIFGSGAPLFTQLITST